MDTTADQPRSYLKQDARFFQQRDDFTRAAAERIVPLLLDLYSPKSVIDLGCGVGTWLSVFQDHGIREVHGIDGWEVDTSLLQISPKDFEEHDLSQKVAVGRYYDLAISLEVAEHLPPGSAGGFVKTLVDLAPVVLFSAAIPNQGGINHVNEQWPRYWAEIFAGHNYVAIDTLRRQIWRDDLIKGWYRQNIFIFARSDILEGHSALQDAYKQTWPEQLDLVHPQIFSWKQSDHQREIIQARKLTLADVARMLPELIRRSIVSRWKILRGATNAKPGSGM